eukprot:scaffold71579_cov63-Phaeocystis_antarctica.AAC.1
MRAAASRRSSHSHCRAWVFLRSPIDRVSTFLAPMLRSECPRRPLFALSGQLVRLRRWVMSVLRHLLLVLGVSLAAGQMSPPPPPSPAPPPPRNTNTSCSQRYCTSPDRYGGTDCWAGSDVEPCTCSRGTARETGSSDTYEV